MRWIVRIFLLLLLGLAGYWLSQNFLQHVGLEKVGMDIPPEVELDISRGYIIPSQQILSYTLSQSPEKIWISSSAMLTGGDNKTASYPYSLTVTVYDKNDDILYRNDFHHQSSASKLVELSIDGRLVPEAFLADAENKLSTSQNVHFQLPPGATRLEISQPVKSPDIAAVILRAYQFVQRSSRVEAIDLWQRLSQKQRRNLTENFPFEAPFLSNQEKSNLAEFRWQPLVPEGDENEDYQSLLLYRVNKQFIATKKHLLSQYEHHADAYKRVSFPIEIAGRYRLEGQHEFSQRDVIVKMQWFNRNDSWMKEREFTFQDTHFSQDIDVKPGLLTFTASVPTSLNLFAVNGLVEEHDHFSSTIMLLPTETLHYRVEHPITEENAPPTPMQIQVRAFAQQDISTGAGGIVTVVSEATKAKASDTRNFSTHSINVDYLPDENSQLANEEFFNWLGVAKKLYLQVSQPTDTLKVTSNQPVLISMYTRIAAMPARRVLPEEKRDWFDYPEGVPDWFSVRPVNWENLINKGSIRLLKHYHRSLLQEQESPEPDETYHSLLRDFEKLDLLDIMVENPYSGQKSKIEENTALNFSPMGPPAASAHLRSQQKKPVQRRWLFIKDNKEPQEIAWTKNGVEQTPFWVAGKWGIVDDNSLFAVRDDQIIFSSDSENLKAMKWWQNDVTREKAVWQQRRAALLAKNQTLQLTNQKTQPQEMLSLVVYSTTTEPVVLTVNLTGFARNPEVKDSYSIVRRHYQIQSQETYSGFQLAGTRRIVARQSFSILLGNDISAGDMQMQIEHLQGDEVFVSVVKRVIKPKPIIERYRTVTQH